MEKPSTLIYAENVGRLTVGGCFGRTLKVLSANPALFFGLSMIAMAIPALLMLGRMGFGLVTIGAASLFLMLIRGPIAYGVYHAVRGKRVRVVEAMKHGLSRLFPVLGASIIQLVLIRIGMYLLIVPGLYLSTRWFVAIPACAVGRNGAVACLGRSADLVRGNGWTVFVLVVIMYILRTIALYGPIFVLVPLASDYLSAYFEGLVLVIFFSTVIAHTLENVMQAVVYYDLLVLREGVSYDALAEVFE